MCYRIELEGSGLKASPEVTMAFKGEWIRKKLVIVGDGACGKTSLLSAFSKDMFPNEEYIPTVFESSVADIEIDGKQVRVMLFKNYETTQFPFDEL